MSEIIHRRNDCRSCGCRDLEMVFSLKPSPIGDAYVAQEQLNTPQPSYPIDLFVCQRCGLAQIMDIIDPEILYGEYIYVTASSHGLPDHFIAYADSVIDRCKLKPDSLIIDIGSNDGTLLRCFQKQGMDVLGVEPASHIAAQATATGIRTLDKFFSPSLAREIVAEYGHAHVITSNNVFANIDDLASWVKAVDVLLTSDGVYVFESFYLADVVKNMVFDFIYHEHLSAFSVKPIKILFERVGFELVAVQHVPTKGGSLRYFVQRPGGPLVNDGSVAEFLALEERMGLYKKETYLAFSEKINRLKDKTRDFLIQAKKEGKSIVGFGASITGTTLIYHFEIGEYLDYLVDDNLAKQGRYSPGLHLPVLPSSALYERKPDYVLVLAWRFAEVFIEKNQAYLKNGGCIVIPVPEFRINPRIHYWRTTFNNGESEAIARSIAQEQVSQGPVVAEFERQLASYLGVPYVIATTSGSMALLMSLWSAGVGPGDEVIVPNRTWISTAHAPLLLGAKVKLVDVEPDRPIIDAGLVEEAITLRTKAIIPVHLCGRSAEMRTINEIAGRHKLVVIEDAAQALGSRNEDGLLGTQSDMGCFSLSVAKIISTGQGGFIATKSEETYRKLVLMRTQGVGDIINPEWIHPGFNFRFTDILASVGIVQLKLLQSRIEKIKKIYQMYAEGIEGLAFLKLIPVNLEGGELPVYVEALCECREKLIDFFACRGIQCRPFYPDLNRADYFNDTKCFPNSEPFEKMGVYLPAGPEQPLDNVRDVIATIRQF